MREYEKPLMSLICLECEEIIATSISANQSGDEPPIEIIIKNPIDLGDLFESE